MDPLDRQVKKVYAAEAEVFGTHKDIPDLSLRELRQFGREIQRSAWWLGAFPARPTIPIKDGRGSEDARHQDGAAHIPKDARRQDVVIHEFCHAVMPQWLEWHGAAFCGLLLWLYGKAFGESVKTQVEKAFRRNRVIWDRRAAQFGPT